MQMQHGNRPPAAVASSLPEIDRPGWAVGLRRLYQVLGDEERSAGNCGGFTDLLARIDHTTAVG